MTITISRRLLTIGAAALFVLAAAALPAFSSGQAAAQNSISVLAPAAGPELFTQIYEQVAPSVVAINVGIERNGVFQQTGSGSGFVVDMAGHIVTNHHVVANANRIEVEFFDGTLTRAEIVGLDPNSDLAVLRVSVPADSLHPVTFADSDGLAIGQTVLAIGSPFGQRWTLTSGIISALDRTIQGLTAFSIGGVIQTDAAINPGNSGGPLLDLNGYVVGVNSQILSATRSSSGIGFAVPGNLALRVAGELIASGRAEYSYIGISGTNVSLSLIEALGLPHDLRGIAVTEALQGGPAARAGLNSAGAAVRSDNGLLLPSSLDIITAINGQRVTGVDDLITYLAKNTAPGDTITLTVLRDGREEISLNVLLASRT